MKKQLLKYYIMLFILMACPVTVFTACSEDDDPTEQNNDNQSNGNGDNSQTETHALVGTWKGEVMDKGVTRLITYCFKADGTGWDNWNGEKEDFTWYTQDNVLNIVYKDDSPYGDGYDEDSFIYNISSDKAYIYEMDDEGKKQDLLGVFTKQGNNNPSDESNDNPQIETHALVGTWSGEVMDKSGMCLVTYCFRADGTGWDNWDGKKEDFTWYTQENVLHVIYKDDSPDGDGYDEESFIYNISGDKAYIYEMDDEGKKQDLLGVFSKS